MSLPPVPDFESVVRELRRRDNRATALGQKLPPELVHLVQTFLPLQLVGFERKYWFDGGMKTGKLVEFYIMFMLRRGEPVPQDWVAAISKYPEIASIAVPMTNETRYGYLHWFAFE